MLITHQKCVSEVPLFSELEISELLYIISNLKTQIFMPNDYIIRKGEIGREMYFITEGMVTEQQIAELENENEVNK